MNDKRPIGFFDSGIGGINVLNECLRILPKENYVFFGDGANAPYGDKCKDDIVKCLINVIDSFLKHKDIKALVLACNTATQAAVDIIRPMYDFPIIGIEPAIKIAVENTQKQVLVMATESTINGVRYKSNVELYGDNRIISLGCKGLVELVESNNKKGTIMYLNKLFKEKNIDFDNIDGIVLGCTHYPFIKDEIIECINRDIEFFDGSVGVAKNLKKILCEKNALADRKQGRVEIFSSLNEEYCMKLAKRVRR